MLNFNYVHLRALELFFGCSEFVGRWLFKSEEICALGGEGEADKALVHLAGLAGEQALARCQPELHERRQLGTGEAGVVGPEVHDYLARGCGAVDHGQEDAVFGLAAEAVPPAGDAAQHGKHVVIG